MLLILPRRKHHNHPGLVEPGPVGLRGGPGHRIEGLLESPVQSGRGGGVGRFGAQPAAGAVPAYGGQQRRTPRRFAGQRDRVRAAASSTRRPSARSPSPVRALPSAISPAGVAHISPIRRLTAMDSRARSAAVRQSPDTVNSRAS
jgi:hypothetical protein